MDGVSKTRASSKLFLDYRFRSWGWVGLAPKARKMRGTGFVRDKPSIPKGSMCLSVIYLGLGEVPIQGFPKLGVPCWGPCYTGILTFWGFKFGVLYFRKPPYCSFRAQVY